MVAHKDEDHRHAGDYLVSADLDLEIPRSKHGASPACSNSQEMSTIISALSHVSGATPAHEALFDHRAGRQHSFTYSSPTLGLPTVSAMASSSSSSSTSFSAAAFLDSSGAFMSAESNLFQGENQHSSLIANDQNWFPYESADQQALRSGQRCRLAPQYFSSARKGEPITSPKLEASDSDLKGPSDQLFSAPLRSYPG